jgi:hypothetical protein
VASLRRQIGSIPECADGSPAWSINGWSAPKLRLMVQSEYSNCTHNTSGGGNGILLRNDDCSLKDAGVNANSIIAPLYDSSCYAEPLVDWDFYQGSYPDAGATAAQLSDACAAVQRKGGQIQRGTASFFAGLTAACGLAGGAGIAVEQDSATLHFCVTHVAPCGSADADGRVCVGDIVVAVDGRLCADGTGLDPKQVAELRRICSGGDGDWLAALQGGEVRAIASPEALREALSGPPGSSVTMTLRRGGEAVEVRLRRQLLRHYAGAYI